MLRIEKLINFNMTCMWTFHTNSLNAKKKGSPDFRFPEVGISGLCTTTSANTLIAVVHLTINIFRQLPAFTSYFHCSSNDTLHM